MSQFMLIIRNKGIAMENLSEEEKAAHMQEWGQWMGGLAQAGKLEGGLPFSTDSSAVLSNGGNDIANTYYTEGDIVVGGYLLLNASDLNEAIELTKGCPALNDNTSSIEVRECLEMSVPAE